MKKFNNYYILPFIHFSNSGKTLSHNKYPYLSSRNSLWDLTSPYYLESKNYTYDKINSLLNININSNSNIVVYKNNILSFDYSEGSYLYINTLDGKHIEITMTRD